jgi:hypothetical protein
LIKKKPMKISLRKGRQSNSHGILLDKLSIDS